MTAMIVGVLLGLAAGAAAGYAARKSISGKRVGTAEARAARLVSDAQREAESVVRQSLVEVKEEISAMRREAEEDLRQRRVEVKSTEARLIRREEQFEARLIEVAAREDRMSSEGANLERIRGELERTALRHQRELERIARMTAQEAKEALMAQIVEQAKKDAKATVREIEHRARE